VTRRILSRTAAAALLALISGPAWAQVPAPDRAKLVVTVVDQTGGVLPGATVTVTGLDAALMSADPAPRQTTTGGMALFESVATGRYRIQAAFPGFETVVIPDMRLRAGETRRTITLPIKKMTEDVAVGRDKQSAAIDPRGNAFSTVLTREQIAALPDDPDEMEAALKAMAPPGSILRVDGFTGGKLPPKSQIRSIRLPRMDQFAAQNHGGLTAMMHIDITTGPGSGPLRGSLDAAFRDEALNARNPFTPVKGEEGLKQGGVTLSGSIVPNRSAFSVNAQQARLFDSGNVLAATPNLIVATAIRRPTDRFMLSARFDQALNASHMLRFSYQRTAVELHNQGVGSFDLFERAFSTRTADNIFRVSENGAVGRRFFSESRLQVRWAESDTLSVVEAPTVRVLDAFTSGGAQRRGGTRAIDFEAASDLDYVRGVHSFRTGLLVEGGRYRSDEFSNYLGTFTFASLADYEAGRPSSYSRRVGDPAIRYSNVQMGAYVQDDYRVRKSLMLSYGLRYEAQSLLHDQNNFSPRLSLTWSPLKSGRTTFRGGVGYFSDWLGLGTYEQTIRVDGFRQQELNVPNPSWPDPGTIGTALPTNRYQLGDGLLLPASLGANAGVDQSISPNFRLSGTYTYRQGSGLLRGRNLNAPVDGVRPDPRFSNVIEVTGDAASRSHMLGVNATLMLPQRRQTMFAANYTFSASETNTTGAFGIPANGDDLSLEWGVQAPRHRVGGLFNTSPMRNLTVGVNFRAQSGMPYTVTTGTDVNRDGVFNDRPAGIGRGSVVTASQWDIGLRVAYTIGFGPRAQAGGASGGPMVVMIGGPGGGMPGAMGGGASDRRFRLELYASAQNVTNHDNYIGYSGVLTSPFYLQPTNVLNPRKIELGMRFGF
jgi:carboxypeptidase family protein